MNEVEFWVGLEYRVCREFAGMPDLRHQCLWCDGLIAVEYLLDGPKPRIVGRAWICTGPLQAEWQFVLLLPRAFRSRDEIEWSSLLPAENMTRWLSLDEAGQHIEIEPAVAVRDAPK